MQRILLIDTETTGLVNPRPVQIAWMEVDADLNEISRFESLVDPECAISAGASGVHGITYDMVANAPTMDELFFTVHNNPWSEYVTNVVAHNLPYDFPMVAPYIGTVGMKVCTLKLARRIYPKAENHKLQTLRYTFGLESGAAHSAMGDVITTHALLKQMATDTGMTFQELAEWVTQPQIVERIGFGKHKGSKLKDLPSQYIHWLLTEATIDDDLKFSLQQL